MFGIGGDEGAQAIRALGHTERYLDKGAGATKSTLFAVTRSTHLIELGQESLARARPVIDGWGTSADIDGATSLAAALDVQSEIASLAKQNLTLRPDADRLRSLGAAAATLKDRVRELRKAGLDDAHAAAAMTARKARPAADIDRRNALDALGGVSDVLANAEHMQAAPYEGPEQLASRRKVVLKLADARMKDVAALPGVNGAAATDARGVSNLFTVIAGGGGTETDLAIARQRLDALLDTVRSGSRIGAAVTLHADLGLVSDAQRALLFEADWSHDLLGSLKMAGNDASSHAMLRMLRRRLETFRDVHAADLSDQALRAVDEATSSMRVAELGLTPATKLGADAVAVAITRAGGQLESLAHTTDSPIASSDVLGHLKSAFQDVDAAARSANELAVRDRSSLVAADGQAGLARVGAISLLHDLDGLRRSGAPEEARAGVVDALVGLDELRRIPQPASASGKLLDTALEHVATSAGEVRAGTATAEQIAERISAISIDGVGGLDSAASVDARLWLAGHRAEAIPAAAHDLQDARQQLRNAADAMGKIDTLIGVDESMRGNQSTNVDYEAVVDLANNALARLKSARPQLDELLGPMATAVDTTQQRLQTEIELLTKGRDRAAEGALVRNLDVEKLYPRSARLGQVWVDMRTWSTVLDQSELAGAIPDAI